MTRVQLPSSPDSSVAEPLLELAERVTAACPAPALLIEAGGPLRSVNRAALDLLGLGDDLVGRPARALLGFGWRELELIAREGDADLLTELPGDAGSRGLRVRLETVGPSRRAFGVVAFLEPVAEPTTTRPSRPQVSGFEALFGRDPGLEAVKEAGARFAGTVLPVLLLAETGTGKELLARAIHDAGPRSRKPFVAINCGALSPHLLQSELFGYAPGAFTGAGAKGNEGKIGAARGGTLFLDEVAEMPGPLQALLLRVLEDGTYYRVGENVARQADVRLVCATCRDLPRLVAEGGFRQDLYYRINGACLSLPTVRRRQDLPELIRYLTVELARELELEPVPAIAPDALALMLGYAWPGNVRQLKTALRHGMIMGGGGTVGIEHLPAEVSGRVPDLAPPVSAPTSISTSISTLTPISTPTPTPISMQTPSGPSAPVPSPPPTANEPTISEPTAGEASTEPAPAPRRTLHELEAERLQRAVEESGGNLTRAARGLGIARTTLYRRLRKHGFLPGSEGSA